MTKNTTPLLINSEKHIYLAYGHVANVYDTNTYNEQIPVLFERLQGTAFKLTHKPVSDVYCDVDIPSYDN